jgi:murein L,D-transpeptidase YcbB/YkuD
VTIQHAKRTGPRPVRQFSTILGAVALAVAAPIFAPAPAQAAVAAVPQGQDVDSFYQLRQGKPLWFQGNQPTAAAQSLIALLSTANADGFDPKRYKVDEIKAALKQASGGDRHAVRKADQLLSEEFTQYARDLRNFPSSELQYIDPALRVGPPSPLRLLQDAANAPSLVLYVANMRWMNPEYMRLRHALLNGEYDGDKQRELLAINLQRARALPADQPRYIVVNTATQQLYMYDGNELADSMKVVVGQQRDDRETPTMAGYLHFASLNPYWNVPPDLAWDDVGQYVKKYGTGYLKSKGYEILSDWGDNPSVVDPSTVDWDAVRDGKIQIRIRQNPGVENFLGTVKYTFSNPFGIYLHDTPRKELLKKEVRLDSGGCIRLQDADRLGRWLFGHELHATSDDPEIKIPLEHPVPVYVMYMTAIPNGGTITYLDDVYGLDAKALAAESGSGTTSESVAAR